jgi:hypothetical protein
MAFCEPAAKLPFATCDACSVTVPAAPFNVTVLLTIVAGPLSTEYVIALAEFELADTVNGKSIVW